eukprot:116964-Pleurochrysis_carterae.AAC.2
MTGCKLAARSMGANTKLLVTIARRSVLSSLLLRYRVCSTSPLHARTVCGKLMCIPRSELQSRAPPSQAPHTP